MSEGTMAMSDETLELDLHEVLVDLFNNLDWSQGITPEMLASAVLAVLIEGDLVDLDFEEVEIP